jgi:hypothetical protein
MGHLLQRAPLGHGNVTGQGRAAEESQIDFCDKMLGNPKGRRDLTLSHDIHVSTEQFSQVHE